MADEQSTIELILEVREFRAKLDQAERDFRAAIQQMATAVKAGMDPSSAEFKELEARVKAAGREFVVTGERGEGAMRKLGDLTGRGAAEVGELRGKLAIARTELDKFNREGAAGLGGVVKGFNGVRAAIAAVATSFVALKVKDFIRGSVEAAVEAEDALGRVQASIEATDGAAGRSLAQIEAIAKRIQETTSIGDEDVLGLANTLLTFEGIVGSTFDRTIDVVVDLSAKTRRGLEETGNAVAKAMSLGAEGISQLRRAGIVLDREQEERIEKLYEAGRVTEAQNILLAELEGKAKGAAVALNDELGGALRNLKDELGEVQEAFGKGFGDEVTADINQTTEAIKGMQQPAEDVGRAVGALTGWFAKLLSFAWPALSASVTGFFALALRMAVESTRGVLGFTEAVAQMVLVVSKIPAPGNVMVALRADAEATLLSINKLRNGIVADAQALSEGLFTSAMEDGRRVLAAFKDEAAGAGEALTGTGAAAEGALTPVAGLGAAQDKAAVSAKRLAESQRAAAAAIREAAAAAQGKPTDVFGREADPKSAQQEVDALRKRKDALEAEVKAGGASVETLNDLAQVKGELFQAEGRLNEALRVQAASMQEAGTAAHGYETAVQGAGQSIAEALPEFESLDENVRRNAGSLENLFGSTARLIPKIEEGARVTTKMAGGIAEGTRESESAARAIAGLAERQADFNARGQAMAEVAAKAAEGAQQLGDEAKTTEEKVADLAKEMEAIKKTLEGTYSEAMLAGQKAHNTELEKTVTLYLAWEACLRRMGELAA